MRRRVVEVIVELLDILAMITFLPRQAEKTLLQYAIAAVP